MTYLLDTQVFLWSVVATDLIGKRTLSLIQDKANAVFVSWLSLWEISLNFSLGKLDLMGLTPEDLLIVANKSDIAVLHVNDSVATSFYKLPHYKHKDPFDRMLIWQAINEKMILVSSDRSLVVYKKDGLRLVW